MQILNLQIEHITKKELDLICLYGMELRGLNPSISTLLKSLYKNLNLMR